MTMVKGSIIGTDERSCNVNTIALFMAHDEFISYRPFLTTQIRGNLGLFSLMVLKSSKFTGIISTIQ